MKSPLVSIVVPVYNAEKYLQRCCESVLNQSYKQIELILVDDGSTDNSLEICESFKKQDARVKVVHKENGGVSSARNKGIEVAVGEFIMFVDSDDWIDFDTVEVLINLALHNGTDIVVYSLLNEYPNIQYPLQIDDAVMSINDIINSYKLIKNPDAILCSVCNKLYKREIIIKNNIKFLDNIKFGEDFIFNSQIIKYIDKISGSSRTMYHYDCSIENSGVRKLYNNYDEFIILMDKYLCKMIDAVKVSPEKADEFRQLFISDRWKYAFMVCLNSDKTIEEKSKIIINWLKKCTCEMKKWNDLQSSKYSEYFNLSVNDFNAIDQAERITRKIFKKELVIAKKQKFKKFIRKVLHLCV